MFSSWSDLQIHEIKNHLELRPIENILLPEDRVKETISINGVWVLEYSPDICCNEIHESASAKTTICGLTECLIHYHGILHSIASNQGTHFTAREVRQCVHNHGIHWSYPVPHHPEAPGLIERINGLLKTQLKYQLGGSSLEGRSRVLQKEVYDLNKCPAYDMVSSIARVHVPRNQGLERGIVSSLLLLVTH